MKKKPTKKFNPELPPSTPEELRKELEKIYLTWKNKVLELNALGYTVYTQPNDTVYLEKIQPAAVVETVGVKFIAPEKK